MEKYATRRITENYMLRVFMADRKFDIGDEFVNMTAPCVLCMRYCNFSHICSVENRNLRVNSLPCICLV